MVDNRLKDCREDLEMTQTELGKVLGVKKQTISNWENGYDIIPFTKLIQFCNLYSYSFDYVCGLRRVNQSYPKFSVDKKMIGIKLRNLRTQLGLSQQEIADECSISRATLCHYELGMNLISTFTLYTICKNHNLSMDAFLRNEKGL